jgi:hypothetical protein
MRGEGTVNAFRPRRQVLTIGLMVFSLYVFILSQRVQYILTMGGMLYRLPKIQREQDPDCAFVETPQGVQQSHDGLSDY